MRAGRLRHRVTLQHLGDRVDDGAGGGSIPYETYATVAAAVVPLEGNELFRAGQYDASISHRVELRYLEGVRPSDRILYKTRVFNVKVPINLEERNRELHLMCEELVTW